jgi:hypothetical protein
MLDGQTVTAEEGVPMRSNRERTNLVTLTVVMLLATAWVAIADESKEVKIARAMLAAPESIS